LGISGNITGIQKEIFPSKALPFIIVMEHHVRQTGVAAASCWIAFFMNLFIITVITLKGINDIAWEKDEKDGHFSNQNSGINQ
jgi:hypothetical protein